MPVDQPFKVDTKSKIHSDIIAAFRERLRLSEQGQSTRLEKWRENEEMQQAYVKESENDAKRRVARDNGEPQYTTIEVPYSYAMMLTLHTYVTTIFLSREPIFQLTGRHGESQTAEMAMEALLAYQVTSGGNLPALYIWLLDPLRYGLGVIGHYWDEEQVAITSHRPQPRVFLGQPVEGTEKMTTVQEVIIGYQGARFYNIRPQDFKPDPRVPLVRFQEGEFVIRFQQLSWSKALQREAAGFYFNLEEAKRQKASQVGRDLGSSQLELPLAPELGGLGLDSPSGAPSQLNTHEFYWEIIPSEYGFGSGKLPEKWVFTISEQAIVIGAQPLGLLSNKWPFDTLEYEVGGYGIYNRSVLEVAQTLNDTLSWLFNSHYYNVRKTLNDQFFVDPSMVTMSDLEDPNPGRLVRLRPAAYGQPVSNFVKQFPVADVTQQNMKDAEIVSELMQRVLGGNDNFMGSVQQGRATATEVRSANTNAQGRMKTVTEWFSATGFAPLTQKFLQLTQQMYDQERQFRIVGDLSQWGQRFMQVTPDTIAGFYDFVPVDGNMPIDRFAQANLWQQIFSGMAQFEEIRQTYDVPKIFAFVAQLAGLKNVTNFRVQVQPDDQIAAQAQAGTLVPISPGNPNEPGQIATLGATG